MSVANSLDRAVRGPAETSDDELERVLPHDFDWLRGPALPIGMILLFGAALAVGITQPDWWRAPWTIAVPIVEILIIIVVMIWPMAGTQRYFAYKRPLFIASIVLEWWIILMGVALVIPNTVLEKDFWFQLGLVSFFLVTAICSLPWACGEYRPGLFFRPDLIFGNGCYLARGEIFVALGIKLLVVPPPAQPIWSWWGLSWAIIAMVMLVPLRGVVKMRMMRARMLGLNKWTGSGLRAGLWLKELYLFAGLIALVYGFANVYMGKMPFTWHAGEPMNQPGPDWWGLLYLGIAGLILVPLRGWYKTTLPEPPTFGQALLKNFILWLGFIPLIYGFLTLLMGVPQLFEATFGWYNFGWSMLISALGFLMVVPLRTITQRDEFRGTMRVMIPRMADLSDATRRLMMGRRLAVVATMPDRPRKENIQLMMRIIHALPEPAHETMVRTRAELVATVPEERRAALMSAMAMAMADMTQDERVDIMAEVMGGVAELPDDQRALMVRKMTALLSS